MKTINLLVILLLAGTLSAWAQKSEIDTSKSQVLWTGKKIGGAHNGKIQIQNGSFELKNGEIVNGNVVIDMNSITDDDLKDAGYNKQLVDHLKSDDFFGVNNHPTATFKITGAGKFTSDKAVVTGLLTIKGKTEKISFVVNRKENVYSTQLKVDRSKFGVRYGSKSFFNNLGDKVIDDIFTLDIKLVLK
ncbi:MAG: YceI family protein [Porphyromonadaceae bacterium]|nr:YceI family protein [Porphyromonadaceae bacterium]